MDIALTEYFAEFEADWVLEGKAEKTATKYVDYLGRFVTWLGDGTASLAAAKKWIATSPTQAGKQERAKALRASASGRTHTTDLTGSGGRASRSRRSP